MKEVECQGIWSSQRAAHDNSSMETLRSPSLATYSIKPKISFYLTLRTVTVGSLYLCGLNKTIIHWELPLSKVDFTN